MSDIADLLARYGTYNTYLRNKPHLPYKSTTNSQSTMLFWLELSRFSATVLACQRYSETTTGNERTNEIKQGIYRVVISQIMVSQQIVQ